jgi:ADP-ribosylglycohydrolase
MERIARYRGCLLGLAVGDAVGTTLEFKPPGRFQPFNASNSFREGLLLAVNLGDDADTTGATCGQLAGAHYGLPGIPKPCQAEVAKADLILQLANQLLSAGERQGNSPRCHLK